METSKDGQVSKRSALELLLWEAVVEMLKGIPSGVVSAARKFEDGKQRLLLTLDTLHYVIYAMVLHITEPAISKHKLIDHAATAWKGYGDFAHRVPSRKANRFMRLFDFADFNSHHTSLVFVVGS